MIETTYDEFGPATPLDPIPHNKKRKAAAVYNWFCQNEYVPPTRHEIEILLSLIEGVK